MLRRLFSKYDPRTYSTNPVKAKAVIIVYLLMNNNMLDPTDITIRALRTAPDEVLRTTFKGCVYLFVKTMHLLMVDTTKHDLIETLIEIVYGNDFLTTALTRIRHGEIVTSAPSVFMQAYCNALHCYLMNDAVGAVLEAETMDDATVKLTCAMLGARYGIDFVRTFKNY